MDARQPAPVTQPVALTVAGSDSGGGAGIQADLHTMATHDVFGVSAVTGATAQHTREVVSTHVIPRARVADQIDACCTDFEIRAVKTGMLATAEIVETVTSGVREVNAPLVVDPVMVATAGDRLLERDAESAYEDLVSHATLVTPNTDEARVLTGIDVTDETTARAAGEELRSMGADAALVTGGHRDTGAVVDVLVTEDGDHQFTHPRVTDAATHGSGCTLSAAITARLAHGEPLETAVGESTRFLERAIRYHHDVGRGSGAVNHCVDRWNEARARETLHDVESVVSSFVTADISALVPEVGTNVAGALPYAERVDEVAAVDGRLSRVHDGVRPTGGVRFGASSHVARFLLAAREYEPSLRFAADFRFDADVEATLETLGWSVAEYDRAEEPDPDAEASTMGWGAQQAFADSVATPYAVVDRGAVGKEPICKLVARDAGTLAERSLTMLDSLPGTE
ncbi:bifunctional hydroxymethylpyrimidine kinase/phosphomethylpyrimidine kinase [Haloarchaeobius sp. TZWWS8]|uniref:bifunctional hydroxymethylpyrimidine kinase/phosphomethylpyrimidine kinase n=1 Tax=Haloarchaeobius sp. TZWWS8 TaxID=3446121 RepID=UPI003EBEE750